MTEEHDKIAQDFGQEIRKILKEQNLYDNNLEFEFKIGRYSISFTRSHGKNEVLRDLPFEVFEAVKNTISELHRIWEKSPNKDEEIGDHFRAEYSVSIIVEGDPFELTDVTEIKKMIKNLEKWKEDAKSKEKYEKAANYRDRITFYKNRLQ